MNIASFVPSVSSLAEVYPSTSHSHQTQRWEHLLARFQEHYNAPAEYVSRSPGRVNIIGEHIDYSLFSVLPMAVEADLLLVFRILPDTNTVTLANVFDSKFPQREFSVPTAGEGDLEIDATKHEWSNYFKSGYRGTLEFLRRNGLPAAEQPCGMQILCDGNVPSGGGLSSSAAFVCASALAAMVSMGVKDVDKKELVSLAIVAERYVGVNAGGMDQSASVLGEDGKALFISFDPELSAEAVAFPKTDPEPVFLIANTYKTVEKHITAPVNYNLRVVECTLSAEVLAKKLEVELGKDAGPLGSSLKGCMDCYYARFPDRKPQSAAEQFAQMAKFAEEHLEESYTRQDLVNILGCSIPTLEYQFMSKFPIRAETFNLRDRARHVFSEAARVAEFHDLLKAGEQNLTKLGELMNQSQETCRDLYQCSCEELDKLCELARGAGSYGSRLTGAGWGGCSVHLVPADKVEDVRKALLEGYYKDRGLSEEELEEAIVVSKPGSGSVLLQLEGSELA